MVGRIYPNPELKRYFLSTQKKDRNNQSPIKDEQEYIVPIAGDDINLLLNMLDVLIEQTEDFWTAYKYQLIQVALRSATPNDILVSEFSEEGIEE